MRPPAGLIRIDPETGHAPKSRTGNHGNHAISGIVHGRMVMITQDQNHRRNDCTTMPPWTQ